MLLSGALLFYALDVPGDLARWLERRRQVRELERRNAELAREIQQRRERLRRLQTSPDEQANRVRKDQLKARPGEKIFILPGAPTQ